VLVALEHGGGDTRLPATRNRHRGKRVGRVLERLEQRGHRFELLLESGGDATQALARPRQEIGGLRILTQGLDPKLDL
jgi:hypothetical protein